MPPHEPPRPRVPSVGPPRRSSPYLRQTLLLFLAIGAVLFGCRRCSSYRSSPTPLPDGSAAADASSDLEPALPGASQEPPKAPPPRRTGLELVRAAIGLWEAQDGGLSVAVDPPHPAPGKRPAYHLVVTKAGAVPYGCDFSDPARVPVQGLDAIDGHELTYRAWCGGTPRGGPKDRGSFLGLSLEDGALRATLTVGGEKKLTSGPMVRRATH